MLGSDRDGHLGIRRARVEQHPQHLALLFQRVEQQLHRVPAPRRHLDGEVAHAFHQDVLGGRAALQLSEGVRDGREQHAFLASGARCGRVDALGRGAEREVGQALERP